MHTPTPQEQILDLAFGLFRSRIVQAFAELGAADALAAGHVTPPALATSLGADAPSLDRLLRAAATLGLVATHADGTFTLTPLGEVLRTGVPGSMHAMVASTTGGAHYAAWGSLAEGIRTGTTPFTLGVGEDVWKYFFETAPAEGAVFNQAMSNLSSAIIPAVLAAYEFPSSGTLVDVGGGNGTLLTAILGQQAGLRGIVAELPFTAPAAEEYLAAHGLADRARVVGGSFFDSVPAAEAYVMKHILHDWNDQAAAAILAKVHAAAWPGARLVLIESVVPEDDSPGLARVMDINMFVMCGGKERTAAEWTALLAAQGFRLERIVPTRSPMFVIEAVKV